VNAPALDDEQVAAATLACLPGITPRRLRALLTRWPDPRAALVAVRDGGAVAAVTAASGPERLFEPGPVDELAHRWATAAAGDLGPLLRDRRTRVFVDGRPGYPIGDDVPEYARPAVLLAEGDRVEALTRPRVAIVGTRAASVHGLLDARELGAFLARHGIVVVSGLAIGVDGAAHEGTIEAGGGAIGVVATGLDVVYPRRHFVLHDRVRRSGLLVSESAFRTQPHRSRFPVRNRIIAALADVVVLIEATVAGGARITADFALEYGRSVLVVPGSRRNPAAAGCNALLAEGAHPLLDPSDVLLALGLAPTGARGWDAPSARPVPGGDARAVLEACRGEAATTDQLVARTGLAPERLARAAVDLERAGWLRRDRGYLWPS
jgi:DNA processing protein